jgi:stalled ribosome alternative rescue factor ArfA
LAVPHLKKLVVDDYAADIVKAIFDCKISGYSDGQIAAMLNAKGILSPAEYKKALGLPYHTPFATSGKAEWSPNAVKRVLVNRAYIGHLEQGKRGKASYRMKQCRYKPREDWNIHENDHEAIIDELDFELVQELMAMDTRAPQSDKALHLFSGFVVCGLCGQPMTAKATAKKSGKTYINYVCSTHKKTGGCQNNNISEKKLYDIVLAAIRQQVASLTSPDEVVSGLNAAALRGRRQASIEGMIERSLQAVKDNSEYLVKSYEHFAGGVISEDEYKMFKNSFNSQIKAAEGNIAALQAELGRMDGSADAQKLVERFAEQGNIAELNRRVVAGLIKAITVNGSKDIGIAFRCESGFAPPEKEVV